MQTGTRPHQRQEPLCLELDPSGRSHRLREMYWERTHEAAVVRRPVAGCGETTLVGHANDFAALLEASEPFIQPHELIVGECMAVPERGEGLDLGEYDPHYPPGYATLLRKGLAGIRDEARERLQAGTSRGRRDFLRAVEISYEAARRYVRRYAGYAGDMASSQPDPTRRAELARISAVCHELATGAPTSFHAALQLLQ
ncbi:MAG: hypothetical protein FJ313_03725, partial [Gemmatimonadetes bacterium]|nr:hypothetical protein [Gemmatimonadota bacterium]